MNRRALAAALALLVAGAASLSRGPDGPPGSAPAAPAEATAEQVHQFCGGRCHAYPPPDSFPRAAWRLELKQAYDFFRASDLRTDDFPSIESVARYYESRAPAELPLPAPAPAPAAAPLRWERRGYTPPGRPGPPGVTNVTLAHLFDKRKLDVLVCDAHRGTVSAFRPYADPPDWRLLATLNVPAHAEVVDLDGDGLPDVLVADLGSFPASDSRVGRVVWLRGRPDGTFTPVTLLEGVGRVADVQAADFRGAGKLDLVVAVFGWRNTGGIVYLENHTTDWDKPQFVPRTLDSRHGAIHVPVCDLNNDGRPDFVALISQEHETVVTFLNEGGGRFRRETVWSAPHPAWGSSGIQLVDLNSDGRLDVLYTNGDTLDPPYLLKPYHGVQWLENKGTFPFTHHPIAPLCGAMRAVAADLTGSGRKDVIAVSFLPGEQFPQRARLGLDSVVLYEQAAPGRFVRHPLEAAACDHLTCAVGDLNGDGKVHLVTGNFFFGRGGAGPDAISLWRNLGP